MNLKKLESIAFELMPKHKNNMRCFHVSGIFYKKKLISVGFNKDITHPKTKRFNYHNHAKMHAELNACIKGKLENYSGHTIAILRINANNNLAHSCPCAGCRDLIRQLGFSKVYYTNENGCWVNVDLSDESKFSRNRV